MKTISNRSTKGRARRHALTIVELLVVVFVIGSLAALLLPAVQAVRESGRRAECVTRLKQFGGGLHSFESANGAFPPASAAVKRNRGYGYGFYAPHAHILPYIEESATFGKINWWRTAYPNLGSPSPGVGISPPARDSVPVFQCPSDAVGSSAQGCRNNFRVCTGPGIYPRNSKRYPDGGLGAFEAMKRFSPAAFTDGLSNTVGACEKLTGLGSGGSWSAMRDFWYSGVANLGPPRPSADAMDVLCASLTVAPVPFYPYAGQTWFYSGYEYTWYNHAAAPNSPTPDCSVDGPVITAWSQGGVFRASSNHPGGVNGMLMDGSVRFFSNEVDLRIWRELSTRSGGESVSFDGD